MVGFGPSVLEAPVQDWVDSLPWALGMLLTPAGVFVGTNCSSQCQGAKGKKELARVPQSSSGRAIFPKDLRMSHKPPALLRFTAPSIMPSRGPRLKP